MLFNQINEIPFIGKINNENKKEPQMLDVSNSLRRDLI